MTTEETLKIKKAYKQASKNIKQLLSTDYYQIFKDKSLLDDLPKVFFSDLLNSLNKFEKNQSLTYGIWVPGYFPQSKDTTQIANDLGARNDIHEFSSLNIYIFSANDKSPYFFVAPFDFDNALFKDGTTLAQNLKKMDTISTSTSIAILNPEIQIPLPLEIFFRDDNLGKAAREVIKNSKSNLYEIENPTIDEDDDATIENNNDFENEFDY